MSTPFRSPWLWLYHQTLDLLYPPLCPGCEAVRLVPDATGVAAALCTVCETQLAPLLPPFCPVCGQARTSQGELDRACANCGGRKFDFDFAIAPFHARGLLREMVHRFKFGRSVALRQALGLLMTRVFDDPRLHGPDWLLVPVPIHRRRLRERTFNQSAELADILAKHTGHQVVHALRRMRHTPPQSRLNRQQRMENIGHAIAPHPRHTHQLHDREILLVDDVFTTGSTSHACASALKAAGAARVAVITLARG